MDSESARMSSAAEAKFRIDGPNSKPRAVKVIALDAAANERLPFECRRGEGYLYLPERWRPLWTGGRPLRAPEASTPG